MHWEALKLNRIITAQWKGMGYVGLARYEPAILPPCPTIRVLSYSNCQRSTHGKCNFQKFSTLRVLRERLMMGGDDRAWSRKWWLPKKMDDHHKRSCIAQVSNVNLYAFI